MHLNISIFLQTLLSTLCFFLLCTYVYLMGRKKNHHKKSHNSNNQNNNSNYPKSSEEDLQLECLEIYELLNDKTKILKEQQLPYCYLISTKWLENWKEYAGYDNLSKEQAKHKKIGKKHPGKINFDLVTDNKQFYQVPLESYDYLNTVVNEKKDQDDDFIAIAKKIWDLFASKYDHIEIKRPKTVTKKGSVLYDGTMLQLEVLIANFIDHQLIQSIENAKPQPKKNLDDQFPCDKMQLSTLWTVTDLYDFFQQYCDAIYDTHQIKIWRLEGYTSIGPIQRGLWEGINKKLQKIPIPCIELTEQKYQGLALDQYLKTNYSLVLEVGKSRIVRAQLPDQVQGYCEQCVKKKPLPVYCLCNEMFYCSQQCRIIDQIWHHKACSLSFDSEDDEQIKCKTVDFNKQQLPICGLDNLGNTCYMNSALQAIVGIRQVTNFFGSNGFQNCIDPKQFKENKGMFLFKFSKFIHRLNSTKESLAPWSLKGQINYFLPLFKGFKQHDANDFLLNFINGLNQQLKKQNEKSFHSVFSSFLGEFNSLIKCPSCLQQIQNDQIFTQLTLPIKQKAKLQTVNYIIYENPQKIVHGVCYLSDSWEKIKIGLGLAKNCLVMAVREGEQAIKIHEDQSVQKTMKKFKRDLIFYPNCEINNADSYLSFLPVTQKFIYGSRQKSPYGYPAVIAVDPQLYTLGSFWIQILKHFCPKQIYQKAVPIKQKYFEQTQSIVVDVNKVVDMSKVIDMSKGIDMNKVVDMTKENCQKTEASQRQVEQIEKDLVSKIQQQCNHQLEQLLCNHHIKVFVNDTKKKKNICFFCQKKCTGCQLPVTLSLSLKQYLSQKLDEVNFEILLQSKLDQQKIQKNLVKSGDATLHDCLELLTEPEQLDQENAWWCDQCQNLVLAEKQLTIKNLPKILIIHLNRFKAQGERKIKNSEPIQYQQFQEFRNKKYQLLSVIIHEGSIQGGHYWAICRRNSNYYIFNDSKVGFTQKICNRNAYVLIYEQV